jgi:hypothetical protein
MFFCCATQRWTIFAQHVQRHRTVLEHHVVEGRQRELRPQRLFRLLAQLENAQHADHVGASLARPGDVALHFLRADAVVDRLLAGPALGVQAGVDHQAPRAEQFRAERAEQARNVAFIPALLHRQALGVQAPAFAVGAAAAERCAGRGISAGRFSSCWIASWKWWPGTASW